MEFLEPSFVYLKGSHSAIHFTCRANEEVSQCGKGGGRAQLSAALIIEEFLTLCKLCVASPSYV